MPIMTWSDSLDIGVDDMNHEHQGLLDLMNELYDADSQGKPGSQKLELLDQLQRSTIAHFEHEETYFDRIGFPGAANHKLIHKNLLERFAGFSDDIHRNNGVIDPEFFEFLRYWLSAHIKGIDMKYGQFANEQNTQRRAG